MAVKQIHIEGVGSVDFQKRRGTKAIRIRINGQSVKVSLPLWVPYKVAVTYVQQKRVWINANRKETPVIKTEDRIGKYHTLKIIPTVAKTMSSRITNDTITIHLPGHLPHHAPTTQQKIGRIIEKALLEQSEMLIPDRIEKLAKKYHFTFSDLRFKRLKGRWGSCDRNKVITINTYLIQLPWELIDYVLVHELSHTEHLNHSVAFWDRVSSCLPNAQTLRRELKKHSPDITL